MTDGPGARQPEGDSRPPAGGPRRIALPFRLFPLPGGAGWPAASPRRPRVLRTYPANALPGAFPEQPPASASWEAREAAAPQPGAARGAAGSAASAGGAPKGRQIPTGRARRRAALTGRKEGGNREGGGGGGGRGRRWRCEGGPADPPRLSITRRSDVTRVLHPDGNGTAHKRACLGFSDPAAARSSRLPAAPLAWKSAQPLAAFTRPRRRHGQVTSGWHGSGP